MLPAMEEIPYSAENLTLKRTKLGLSVDELAIGAKLSASSIYKLEKNGKNGRDPSVKTLAKLGYFFSVLEKKRVIFVAEWDVKRIQEYEALHLTPEEHEEISASLES